MKKFLSALLVATFTVSATYAAEEAIEKSEDMVKMLEDGKAVKTLSLQEKLEAKKAMVRAKMAAKKAELEAKHPTDEDIPAEIITSIETEITQTEEQISDIQNDNIEEAVEAANSKVIEHHENIETKTDVTESDISDNIAIVKDTVAEKQEITEDNLSEIKSNVEEVLNTVEGDVKKTDTDLDELDDILSE